MNYLLECTKCGATVWAHGDDDPDTNSFEVDPPPPNEWDLPKVEQPTPFHECSHDDYNVADQEYPESYESDVI